MAAIIPFRALRPTPASAPHVAAVPYDVVNAQEAKALADGNPLSFLHVSRAEIDLSPDTDPYSDGVYRKAVENFDTLKKRAPLVVEDEPSLYVYRLKMGDHVQTGIAGSFSIDEYDRDVIKKHERTRPDKEDDRTRHMLELREAQQLTILAREVLDLRRIDQMTLVGACCFELCGRESDGERFREDRAAQLKLQYHSLPRMQHQLLLAPRRVSREGRGHFVGADRKRRRRESSTVIGEDVAICSGLGVGYGDGRVPNALA